MPTHLRIVVPPRLDGSGWLPRPIIAGQCRSPPRNGDIDLGRRRARVAVRGDDDEEQPVIARTNRFSTASRRRHGGDLDGRWFGTAMNDPRGGCCPAIAVVLLVDGPNVSRRRGSRRQAHRVAGPRRGRSPHTSNANGVDRQIGVRPVCSTVRVSHSRRRSPSPLRSSASKRRPSRFMRWGSGR